MRNLTSLIFQIQCLELYTDERIHAEEFARGETIEELISQVEDLYSTHFGECTRFHPALAKMQNMAIQRKQKAGYDTR